MSRRGFVFEYELNRLKKYLETQGVHMHKNHAERTEQGIYLEGEPFDYEVFVNGDVHCFDAKECSGARWNLKNAKLNQLNNLLMCAKNGAQAYFLVWFKTVNKIIRYDAEQIKKFLTTGGKSVKPEDGKLWEWTELNTSKKNGQF